MKEIDFLPEWYKSGRRRQISYHTQYVVLGGMFAMMMVWHFTATGSVSKAVAELTCLESKQVEMSWCRGVSREFAKIKTEVAELQKKAESIEKIDSKIDVAKVLAELSFLIDEEIVLNKLVMSSEFLADIFSPKSQGAGTKSHTSGSTLRVAGGGFGEKLAPLVLGTPYGETLQPGNILQNRRFLTGQAPDVRFKVVINGVARPVRNSTTGEHPTKGKISNGVAELICRLEDSPYFCQVYLSFLRNTEIKAATVGMKRDTRYEIRDTSYQVSEFEISCYLANYDNIKNSANSAVKRKR